MKLVDGFYYPENVVQASVFYLKPFEYSDVEISHGDDDWMPLKELRGLIVSLPICIRIPLSVVAEVCTEGPMVVVFVGIERDEDSEEVFNHEQCNANALILANFDMADYHVLMKAITDE